MNSTNRKIFPLVCFVIALLCSITGCQRSTERSQNATILVWHDWPEPQSAALEELLRGFEEVYPHITVVVEYVATEGLRYALQDQTAAGLGPDLIIESDLTIVADLQEAGLLVDLSKEEEIDTQELLQHAVDALRIGDGLYGIPFSAHTNILYFNKSLIETPPALIEDLRSLWTIEEIRSAGNGNAGTPAQPVAVSSGDPKPTADATDVAGTATADDAQPTPSTDVATTGEDAGENADDAAVADEPDPEAERESIEKAKQRVVAQIGSFVGRHDGRQVALATDFYHGFWGIRAFGGTAFDESGRLTIDEGFTGWLKWLLEIQHDPAIILDNNYDDLVDAFANGRTALMIGDSAEFVELQRKLGVEKLGVSTLPEGASPAGGLLELEIVSISKLTSNKKICCQVIGYLCNEINQRKLALSEVGQIPINRKIRFDYRLMPVAATLSRQIKRTSTISLSNVRFQERMFQTGNEIYLEVLAGELELDEALQRFEKELARRTEQEGADGA